MCSPAPTSCPPVFTRVRPCHCLLYSEEAELFVVKTTPGKLEISHDRISGTFEGQKEIQHLNGKQKSLMTPCGDVVHLPVFCYNKVNY